MKLSFCLALASAVMFIGWLPVAALAAPTPTCLCGSPKAPSPHAPLYQLLGPCGFFVGYISMNLKRQIHRRGYLFGPRRAAFSDLLHLHGPPDAAPKARPDRPSEPPNPRN
jgi:hypothetical protein